MSELFDVESWRAILIDSMGTLGSTIAAFLPKLLGLVLILVFGWFLAKFVESLAARALHRVGLDRLATNLRVTESMSKAGLAARPSRVVARIVFWILILTLWITAADSLGLDAVTTTIDRLVAFMPSIISAGLVVLFGLLLARLARNLVTSGAAAANISAAERLGSVAYGLIVAVVAVLAMEELKVDTQILVTVITALVSAVALTTGAAFALGARPVVTHILAGHFLRQTMHAGTPMEVAGRRGIVEQVGPLETVFRQDESTWTIPNARLLEEVKSR